MLLAKVLLASWRQQWQQILLVIFGLLTASAGLSSVLVLNETARQKMAQLDTPFSGKPKVIATIKDDNGLNRKVLSNGSFTKVTKNNVTFDKKAYAALIKQGLPVVGLAKFQLEFSESELAELPAVNIIAMDVTALLTQASRQKARKSDASTEKSSAPLNADLANWQKPLISQARIDWFQNSILPSGKWPLPAPTALPHITDDNIYISMMLAGTLDEDITITELWFFEDISTALSNELNESGFELQFITTDTGTLTNSFYINITAMGLLMFTVSMFISLNAYNLLVNGRKRFMKQLFSLGVSVKQLKILFAVETNLLTLVCCCLGFLLGLVLAELVSPGMQMTLRNLYDVKFTAQNVTLINVWLTVVSAGALAANLILLFPFSQSLKQLKPETKKSINENLRVRLRPFALPMSIVALLLIITLQETLFNGAMVQGALLPVTLIINFLLITLCVLLGCVIVLLLIPKMLNLVKQNINPAKPLIHYFASDAVRLSNKSRIAVCAFFIAITSNIGMNLMVRSFKAATELWIEQQFVADYYLSTSDTNSFNVWANEQYDIDVYHRAKAQVSFKDRKTEIIALNEKTPNVNAFNEKALNDNPQNDNTLNGNPLNDNATLPADTANQYNLLFKHVDNAYLTAKSSTFPSDLIFINEQMSIRHNLRLKDSITLGALNFTIAGIYYDYGNLFNQVLLSAEIMSNFKQDNAPQALYSITFKPGKALTPDQLETELDKLDVSYYNGQQIKNISISVFEQTFVITSGLNLITLLVAGASLATSILIIESQNTQQTRIINQMGVSGFTLWLGSLVQYLYLITLVFLLSIPFGILLSYQLINKINHAAFQWSYPLAQDFLSYVLVYITAVFTVLLAVSLPWLIRFVFSRTKPYSQQLISGS